MLRQEKRKGKRAGACCALLMIAGTTGGLAQTTIVSPIGLGGGNVRYELTVDNRTGLESVSGLTILEAGTAFGLNGTSAIGQPAGWINLPPGPGADELAYASTDLNSDVFVGATQGGFSFESASSPAPFGVELIGSTGLTVFRGLAGASYYVVATAANLGGGLFDYSIQIGNSAGLEPISGLTILNGNTVFGVEGAAGIQAPAGYDALASDANVDELTYFSLDPSTDIVPGDTLSGFRFQSRLNPDRLTAGFGVELIGASGDAVFLGTAFAVPEPGFPALLAGLALPGIALLARRRSWRVHSLQR